jgi:hypothetical protein
MDGEADLECVSASDLVGLKRSSPLTDPLVVDKRYDGLYMNPHRPGSDSVQEESSFRCHTVLERYFPYARSRQVLQSFCWTKPGPIKSSRALVAFYDGFSLRDTGGQ